MSYEVEPPLISADGRRSAPPRWPRPFLRPQAPAAADTIDVGVLFSLTGGLSIIEKSLHDATLMAISEINAIGRRHGQAGPAPS